MVKTLLALLPVFLGLLFLLGFMSFSLTPVFFTGKDQISSSLPASGLEVSSLLGCLWIGLFLFVFLGLIVCFLGIAFEK